MADRVCAGACGSSWSEVAEQRRRSPAHLSRWYNLVGYCLRPGFGDPLDSFRIEQLWKLLQAPRRGPRRARPGRRLTVEGGADFWIMWRRAAGRPECPCSKPFTTGSAVLLPGKGKAYVKPGANELAEMWRAAAVWNGSTPSLRKPLGQTPAQTTSPQSGADLWLLGADPARSTRLALRPAEHGGASRRSPPAGSRLSCRSSRAIKVSDWRGPSALASWPDAPVSAPGRRRHHRENVAGTAPGCPSPGALGSNGRRGSRAGRRRAKPDVWRFVADRPPFAESGGMTPGSQRARKIQGLFRARRLISHRLTAVSERETNNSVSLISHTPWRIEFQ